ncbi:MAG: PH domain-containing protein [Verrucomicrobiota bacterium]
MGLLQNVMGNVTELPVEKAQKEFAPVLAKGESVVKAFNLFRDRIVMTNSRLITVDKQGVTGTRQTMLSIPYSSIIKFAKESAGLFDLDAELRIWVKDEAEPLKWQFSRGVDINEVYRVLGEHVIAK